MFQRKVSIVTFVFLFIACSNFSIAAVTFSDGTFSPADWNLHVFEIGTGGSITMTQQPTGGNPGDCCRVYLTVGSHSVYSVLAGFYENVNAVYDPGTQGAITSIDYSEDGIMYTGFGNGQTTGPALIQNGKVYYYLNHDSHSGLYANSRTWSRISEVGATEADFVTFCEGFRCINWDDNPDFSENGSPIRFGFYRHDSLGPYVIDGGIDNWSLTIHQKPKRTKVYALLVGCEQFAKGVQYHGMKDATLLKIALQTLPSTSEGGVEVLEINGSTVNPKTKILEKIAVCEDKTAADDTFVFFVGAHGMEIGGCIALHVDLLGDGIRDVESQLTRSDLVNALNQFNPQVKKVVIIPGCYSGSFWSSNIEPGLVSVPNTCLFAGAPGDKAAYMVPPLFPNQYILPWYLEPDYSGMTPLTITIANGLFRIPFTYSPVDFNHDGIITFQELNTYIVQANVLPIFNFNGHYGGWNEFVNLEWPILEGMGTLVPFTYNPYSMAEEVFGNLPLANSLSNVGDFEPDGDIDLVDFARLANAWQTHTGGENWDFSCDISDPNDDVINDLDLATFAAQWLEGVE